MSVPDGRLAPDWPGPLALERAGCDVFLPAEWFPTLHVVNNVKRLALDRLARDAAERAWLPGRFLLNASVVVARRSAQSLAFMRAWLALCMDEELLVADNERAPDESPVSATTPRSSRSPTWSRGSGWATGACRAASRS